MKEGIKDNNHENSKKNQTKRKRYEEEKEGEVKENTTGNDDRRRNIKEIRDKPPPSVPKYDSRKPDNEPRSAETTHRWKNLQYDQRREGRRGERTQEAWGENNYTYKDLRKENRGKTDRDLKYRLEDERWHNEQNRRGWRFEKQREMERRYRENEIRMWEDERGFLERRWK